MFFVWALYYFLGVSAFKEPFPCGEIDLVHAPDYCFHLVGLRITKPRNGETGMEHFVSDCVVHLLTLERLVDGDELAPVGVHPIAIIIT